MKDAVVWRFEKLCEEPKEVEEPKGICESVDYMVWGKLSWCQKAISYSLRDKKRLLKEVLKNSYEERRSFV